MDGAGVSFFDKMIVYLKKQTPPLAGHQTLESTRL
jgi:hypothetical protein